MNGRQIKRMNFEFKHTPNAGEALYLNGSLKGWVCKSTNGEFRYLIHSPINYRSTPFKFLQAARMAIISHCADLHSIHDNKNISRNSTNLNTEVEV